MQTSTGPLTPSNLQQTRPNTQKMRQSPLTADRIAFIKSTVPIACDRGTAVTIISYANMLAAHPELKNLHLQVRPR
ncbi:hypothetical protein TgHK011_002294 [Trichoderma gracile]|nr:hypothetical protein TgHK011_002294 [Trichoderma gracile]